MQHPSKSAADVAARVSFFEAIAHDLIASILSSNEVIFRAARLQPMADAYFLLNDAYKRWRITAGHRTKPSKIAALTCMTISTFVPFSPKHINQVTSIVHLRANEMYALACAFAILQNPLGFRGNMNKDIVLRIMDIVSVSKSATLELFRTDLNYKIVKPSYTLNIADEDKLPLDSLITIFELLEKQFATAATLATV